MKSNLAKNNRNITAQEIGAKIEQPDIANKRKAEKELVSWMIRNYCKGNHLKKGYPCKECQELIDYASMRSDKCPFMETKSFCSNCKVHCYKPEMREKIKKVMRYSGPRMLLTHPVLLIKHVYLNRKRAKLNKIQHGRCEQ